MRGRSTGSRAWFGLRVVEAQITRYRVCQSRRHSKGQRLSIITRWKVIELYYYIQTQGDKWVVFGTIPSRKLNTDIAKSPQWVSSNKHPTPAMPPNLDRLSSSSDHTCLA